MASSAPRGWLGKTAGVFSLHESDRTCGSYISIRDAATILKVDPAELDHYRLAQHGEQDFTTDKTLGRAWASGQITSPRTSMRRGNSMVSFDELIVLTLIELTLPGAAVHPQKEVDRFLIDFLVEHNGVTIALEFCGPHHFIRRHPGERTPLDPRVRAERISRLLNVECVIWPYWVQRCESNVRALFDSSVRGIASVWSTSAQFGNFSFPDSHKVIQDINARFRVERETGIGYMYTDEIVSKPVHPVVSQIRRGRESVSKLVPPGSTSSKRYWVPRVLWSVIDGG